MPSLPQAAFAVCKLREQSSRPSKGQDSAKGGNGGGAHVYNQKLLEYLPVKYNEKFMNAIWGHYNRYSPHNIKSNDAAISVSIAGQNLMSAATYAATSVQYQPN